MTEREKQIQAVRTLNSTRHIITSWKMVCEVEKWRLDGLSDDERKEQLRLAREALNRALRSDAENRREDRSRSQRPSDVPSDVVQLSKQPVGPQTEVADWIDLDCGR